MFARDYNNNEQPWIPDLSNGSLDEDFNEWLDQQLHFVEQLYPQLKTALEEKRTRQHEYEDKRRKQVPTFEVGERVLAIDYDKSRKDDPQRVGPYKIVEVRPTGSYVISDGINLPLVRHVSSLQRYHEPSEDMDLEEKKEEEDESHEQTAPDAQKQKSPRNLRPRKRKSESEEKSEYPEIKPSRKRKQSKKGKRSYPKIEPFENVYQVQGFP
jgi:hypothetical protein